MNLENARPLPLSEEQKGHFREDGYLIVKGLFSERDVSALREAFMNIQAKGPIPGYFEPTVTAGDGDPLAKYPRILYPHRFLKLARDYMLHPPVLGALAELFGEEPLAAQSMFYFKPPGARGQALHQDNYYLRAEPGTCIAAWTAVDAADEDNGGLYVVPKTQREEIQCPHEADPEQSFVRDEVIVPEGLAPIPVLMDAGDVLFFNGSTIHGSYPNRSKDRFRRSFICHYVGASTLKLGHHICGDLHNAKGEIVRVAGNEGGGPCGADFEPGPH